MLDMEYIKRKMIIKDYFCHEQKIMNAPVINNYLAIKKATYKRLIKHYEPTGRDVKLLVFIFEQSSILTQKLLD